MDGGAYPGCELVVKALGGLADRGQFLERKTVRPLAAVDVAERGPERLQFGRCEEAMAVCFVQSGPRMAARSGEPVAQGLVFAFGSLVSGGGLLEIRKQQCERREVDSAGLDDGACRSAGVIELPFTEALVVGAVLKCDGAEQHQLAVVCSHSVLGDAQLLRCVLNPGPDDPEIAGKPVERSGLPDVEIELGDKGRVPTLRPGEASIGKQPDGSETVGALGQVGCAVGAIERLVEDGIAFASACGIVATQGVAASEAASSVLI